MLHMKCNEESLPSVRYSEAMTEDLGVEDAELSPSLHVSSE